MKKNLTELVFILDKSGSMAGLENDTISTPWRQRAGSGSPPTGRWIMCPTARGRN